MRKTSKLPFNCDVYYTYEVNSKWNAPTNKVRFYWSTVYCRSIELSISREQTLSTMPSTRAILSAGVVCLLGASGYSYVYGKSWFFKAVAMPLAARVDPETAHTAAVYISSKGLAPRDPRSDPKILVT